MFCDVLLRFISFRLYTLTFVMLNCLLVHFIVELELKTGKGKFSFNAYIMNKRCVVVFCIV